MYQNHKSVFSIKQTESRAASCYGLNCIPPPPPPPCSKFIRPSPKPQDVRM